MKIKNLLTFFLFLSLGCLILYLVYHKQQVAYEAECVAKGITSENCSLLTKVYNDIKGANWVYLIISIGFFVLSNVLRAVRWNLLTEPLGYKMKFINAFGAVTIAYFTNLALPRIGELIRAGVISKYENIPSEKAFGTIITERIIDVVIFFFVSMLALIFAYQKVSEYLFENAVIDFKSMVFPMSLLIILLIMMGVLYKYWGKIETTKIGAKVSVFIKGLIEGLLSIKKLEKRGLFITYSLAIWACYFIMTYVSFNALTATSNLPPQAALVSLFLGSVGMIIPSPGGMGTYQFMISEALSLYGVAGSDGFSYANLNFIFISIIGNISLGLAAYVLLPIINRKSQS
ncbi:MAG TPA: lysylphosphatidylglycerol synthase transmembrane domain-containing protein [Saprospiraceae bacterium]|nr:lysylphosphatidylglycerol synthase transmembrane domain-containing protein [Saprospiraceae bacterium]HPN67926.1 lysylphosphatidylglycerol synthase transmembrane domain-containing protein [Saprospiraceae bacterium]